MRKEYAAGLAAAVKPADYRPPARLLSSAGSTVRAAQSKPPPDVIVPTKMRQTPAQCAPDGATTGERQGAMVRLRAMFHWGVPWKHRLWVFGSCIPSATVCTRAHWARLSTAEQRGCGSPSGPVGPRTGCGCEGRIMDAPANIPFALYFPALTCYTYRTNVLKGEPHEPSHTPCRHGRLLRQR